MIGDFNSISYALDKKGGSTTGEVSSRYFRDFSRVVGTVDLGFSGPKFTWSNRKVGWANIRERLDRGICNAEWQALFPKAGVRHLVGPNSDHNPIILDTHMEQLQGVKPFRFEAIWTKDDSIFEVVDQA